MRIIELIDKYYNFILKLLGIYIYLYTIYNLHILSYYFPIFICRPKNACVLGYIHLKIYEY